MLECRFAVRSMFLIGNAAKAACGEQLAGCNEGTKGVISSLRHYATSESSSSHQSTSSLAADLLQKTQVIQLQGELEKEAETSLRISFLDFVNRAKSSGAASSESDAEAVCQAFESTGVLVRQADNVYLRVDEIINFVAEALPGGIHDARSKLHKIEEELSDLEKKIRMASTSAERFTTVMLGTGFVILFTQFIAFIYLTWFELSWDVMEPFSYIIQLFYAIVAYAYFMATRGAVFDLGAFRETWMARSMKAKMYHLKVDEERYKHLLTLKDRYKKHISLRAFRA